MACAGHVRTMSSLTTVTKDASPAPIPMPSLTPEQFILVCSGCCFLKTGSAVVSTAPEGRSEDTASLFPGVSVAQRRVTSLVQMVHHVFIAFISSM